MSTELVESILREVKNNPIMRSESMKGVKPVVYSEFEGIDDKEVVPTGFAELDYVLQGKALSLSGLSLRPRNWGMFVPS